MVHQHSLEAYERLRASGAFSEKQLIILLALAQHIRLAAYQVDELHPELSGANRSCQPALTHLKNCGTVREVGKIIKPDTDNNVTVYELTGRGHNGYVAPKALTQAEWASAYAELYDLMVLRQSAGEPVSKTLRKLIDYAIHKGFPEN